MLECDIRIWDEIIATLSDTHDKDVFNYLMKFLATLVHGDCTNDTFQIWTGTGANGTGLTKTILTKAFGNYLYEPAQTVFANRAVSRTCLSNKIAKLQGKRLYMTSECEGARPYTTSFAWAFSSSTQVTIRFKYANCT